MSTPKKRKMKEVKPKKTKLHWLNYDKKYNPVSCVCGGSIVILCDRLFKKMTKKSKPV